MIKVEVKLCVNIYHQSDLTSGVSVMKVVTDNKLQSSSCSFILFFKECRKLIVIFYV